MPRVNPKLDTNVRVSVSLRFIKDRNVREVLQQTYDLNAVGLSFKGRTLNRVSINGNVGYEVILDEVSAITMAMPATCLKYLSSNNSSSNRPTNEAGGSINIAQTALTDSDDSEGEETEEEEVDLTETEGWAAGEVYIDSRVQSTDGFASEKSKFNMVNYRTSRPVDYFLMFLPLDHFRVIITNINDNARSTLGSWTDVTFVEYMFWIAILSVMTVVQHSDMKAYWNAGNSHFKLTIDCSKYMSYKRFKDIMRMHVFEVYSAEKLANDRLYQIRATLDAFNAHMSDCLVPGKYLVVDGTMNQWLGVGMPNVKKVPRKPHSIGQEFKSLADYHTNCILRLDTVSDPCTKEYDNDPGMRNLLATVKRLVKPWFSSGRTVIADSWFGSPTMVSMLNELGLYSIMQVTKRRYWPRGMPTTDIVAQVDESRGSHYTMHKTCDNGKKIFVCAYRDKKVKAFVSSCGTTRPIDYKGIEGNDGQAVDITRPEAIDEYEKHKSSVDTANNRRDNLISYHDVISTERWEMRFLGFILGICEANAFSCYKVFANGGDNILHGQFKDTMAFQLLKHCEQLADTDIEANVPESMNLRSKFSHELVPLTRQNSVKRIRLSCKYCHSKGVRGTRVEKSCACNPDTPICKKCYKSHLLEAGAKAATSYHSL